jgi:hypothetical protein
MDEALELKLVEKFPKLLTDYKCDPKESCLAFGMECDDGWYILIHDYLTQVTKMCELDKSITANIQQIKEKFGKLRIYTYIDGCDEITKDIIYSLAHYAEEKSANVCEVSGNYGSLCHSGSWYKTLSYDAVKAEGSNYSDYVPADQITAASWERRDRAKKSAPIAFGVGDHPDYKYDDSI